VRSSIPLAAEESPAGDSSLPAHQPSAVERRAIEPAPGAAGPAFARGLWRIAAADVSSGNDVQLLHDGPATFDAMCDAIDTAQETIVLEA
jgi:phosphatidylserine/phosphatidylglycerophosphate/cardiolipin synthase-like enzyme